MFIIIFYFTKLLFVAKFSLWFRNEKSKGNSILSGLDKNADMDI
jgi:hypothetical protein